MSGGRVRPREENTTDDHIRKHMPMYPNCSTLLIEYVDSELASVFRNVPNWSDEYIAWEEQVEYFEGKQEEPYGRTVNLVYFFAYWTNFLGQDFPTSVKNLYDKVAHETSITTTYHPDNISTFYVSYRGKQVDLTFTVLVIRAMLLKARPVVAESLPVRVDMHLLEWIEDLLGMFPMSRVGKQTEESGIPVYVNMEKVDMDGLIRSTGWPYLPDQTVATLLTKTWGKEWPTYRVA